MKKKVYNIFQRNCLRLSLCAMAFAVTTVSYAQDETAENEENQEETAIVAPKRTTIKDTNPIMTVSGLVLDYVTKQPVAGVRVSVLGDARYTSMTDAEGRFDLNAPTFTTSLYVTAPRYSAQQVSIKQNDTQQQIKIQLLSSKFKDMYFDGTDYTAKRSIAPIGGAAVIDDNIQEGLYADVRSIARTGAIDGGNAMFIRGINSLNANSQPMIIVDGVEYDMQYSRSVLHLGHNMNMLANISPEDIAKVTVLKNATALYGARGANGVVLIETKRGHSMATRIDANISAGVTLKPTMQTLMNANQYRNYATQMIGTISDVFKSENRDLTFNFLNDDRSYVYYQTYHNDTDWSKEVYRTAITQNYNINVQGGDDIGMYNLSVGYFDSDSPIKETNYNRLNVRFNTDIQLLWNLKTKFDMSFARTNNTLFDDGFAPNVSSQVVLSPTNLAQIKSPLLAPYQYNKHINGFTSLLSSYDDLFSALSVAKYNNNYYYSLANPTAIIENGTGDNKNKLENTFFNIHVQPTYEFNSHLKLTTLFSYVLNRNSQRYYRPAEGIPPFLIENLGTVYNKTGSLFSKENNILSNTHLDWSNVYGANVLAATVGFRYNYFSFKYTDVSSQYKSAQNDKNPVVTANSSAAFSDVQGTNDTWKNMQWYANVDYSYNNRFFATVSLTAEANSRFGRSISEKTGIKLAGVRWVLYPSVQLGWVMSNENWFPKNTVVNYLKVYGGFDVSGNDDINNYAAYSAFTPVKYNNTANGLQLTNIGNDEIKAETTTKWNVGFVTNLFANRLSIGADFYVHTTSDLLALADFNSPIGGIKTYWTNNGRIRNSGLELALSGKPVVSKDLTLELGATLGHYKNEVKNLVQRTFADGSKTFTDGSYCESVYGDNNILVSPNNPIGLFYGYQTASNVFATEAEASTAYNGSDYLKFRDATGSDQTFNAGDVHFIDQNGDGYIDEQDKVVIGNPNPDIYGNIFATLNWKRFTLSMNFNYCIGNDVYNYQRSILNSGSTFYNQQIHELAYWHYEGQVTDIPRLAYGDPKGNNRFSDRWIEDGSYLRLKNVRLTYNIPIPESWESWLQGLSVWGEAQNVFTISKYTGVDPEFSAGNGVLYQGIDTGAIAQSRAFVLGLKINL